MLFSIKDVKTGIYDRPFIAENAEEAKRSLDILFRSPEKSIITMYPDDFILYQVGDFDKSTGVVLDLEHIQICRVSEIAIKYQPKLDIPDFVKTPLKTKKSKKE